MNRPNQLKPVVIVDDDKSYANLLTQLLAQTLDCPIVSFSHPREALAALPGLAPGMIVTDFEMPGLNGFEFMAEAAKLVPGVPFILITGHPMTAAFEDQISASPAKTVLPKPFNWRILGDEIIRHWPKANGPLLKAHPASV